MAMISSLAFPVILFILSLLFLLLVGCRARVVLDSHLIAGDGGSWISPSGDFAFGFRSLEDKDFFLLCIWFNRIPDQTIVWYADGGNPAPRNSIVDLTKDGQLVLTNPEGHPLWKAETINPGFVAYAAMLDNGNFVLESENSDRIWESFSQPTDTLLPGQTLQVGSTLSSRQSSTDYSRGMFQLRLLYNGTLVLNLVTLPSYYPYPPYFAIGANPADHRSTLVFNESGQLYIKWSDGYMVDLSPPNRLPSADFYHRATLGVRGGFYLYAHPKPSHGGGTKEWSIEKSFPKDVCADIKGLLGSGACGYNSYCEVVNGMPKCKCPPEYSLKDPNNSFGGCKPNAPIVCEDGESGSPDTLFEFKELKGTDWPLSDYERIEPVSEEDCKNSCLLDCYCAVVTYKNLKCWKKRLPLSNGCFKANYTLKVFFKVRPAKSSSMKNKGQTIPILHGSMGGSLFMINFLLLAAICLTAFIAYQRRSKISKLVSSISERDLERNPLQPQTGQGQVIGDEPGLTNLQSFTYEELEEAINSFKEILEEDDFSIVYKGLHALGSYNLVAVRSLKNQVQEGESELFQTEVSVMGQIDHRNLVRLIGFCEERPNRLLVYEFMSKGSLARFLFESPKPHWHQRTQIAVGIATGLAYLHEECCPQIIHCDIKPQNILLDDFFCPKISNFGWAMTMMPGEVLTCRRTRGTAEYMAPEWNLREPNTEKKITVEVDVYSFGVMLLEIISCRSAADTAWSGENNITFTGWAVNCYRNWELEDLVDGDMDAIRDDERLVTWLIVAIWCIKKTPSERPTMKKVLQMLEGTVDVFTLRSSSSSSYC